MTLLDEIKKINYQKKGSKEITAETKEISLAWLTGEIQGYQIVKVLNVRGSNLYNFLARNIKAAYNEGKIKIVK